MRGLVTGLAAALIVCMATCAWANQPVAGVQAAEGPAVETPSGRDDYIDAWNPGGVPTSGSTYAADCWLWPYTPSEAYWLKRVEFVDYGPYSGDVTVEVWESPSGPALAGVTYFEGYPAPEWHGADFDHCVYVEPGTTVYIYKRALVGNFCSFAESGVLYEHYWDFYCDSWDGSATSFPWMLRFYGGYEPTATETGTWGAVKSLYR